MVFSDSHSSQPQWILHCVKTEKLRTFKKKFLPLLQGQSDLRTLTSILISFYKRRGAATFHWWLSSTIQGSSWNVYYYCLIFFWFELKLHKDKKKPMVILTLKLKAAIFSKMSVIFTTLTWYNTLQWIKLSFLKRQTWDISRYAGYCPFSVVYLTYITFWKREPFLAGLRGEKLLSWAHYEEPVSTAVQLSNQDPTQYMWWCKWARFPKC